MLRRLFRRKYWPRQVRLRAYTQRVAGSRVIRLCDAMEGWGIEWSLPNRPWHCLLAEAEEAIRAHANLRRLLKAGTPVKLYLVAEWKD